MGTIVADQISGAQAIVRGQGATDIDLTTNHDEPPDKQERYVMNDWLLFSSTDMKSWKAHGSPLSVKDFSWAASSAWAGHVIEKEGKFYC